MTDLKNNLEEAWREEYEEKFDVDNLSKDYYSKFGRYDTESECDKWEIYRESKKKSQEEIKQLEQELELLKLERDEFKKYSTTWFDKKNELAQELQKTREQLEVAEAVLSVQCTDSALAYFKDKQGE